MASITSSSSASVWRRRAESALKRAIESSQWKRRSVLQTGQPAATRRRIRRSEGPRPRSRCRRTGKASDRPGCDGGRTAPAWQACRPLRCAQPKFRRRNIPLPWLQSQALRRRPSPAEYTTDMANSPAFTSRQSRRAGEKSSGIIFSRALEPKIDFDIRNLFWPPVRVPYLRITRSGLIRTVVFNYVAGLNRGSDQNPRGALNDLQDGATVAIRTRI